RESKKKRRYYPKFLNSEIPIINLFILTYKNGVKEVMFGWAYSNDRPFEGVFISNDFNIVQYMSMYFESIFFMGKEIGSNE
ncbi:MAG: hypothetical protein AAGC85_16470, partial [Bacteroidota bacterium]